MAPIVSTSPLLFPDFHVNLYFSPVFKGIPCLKGTPRGGAFGGRGRCCLFVGIVLPLRGGILVAVIGNDTSDDSAWDHRPQRHTSYDQGTTNGLGKEMAENITD